MAETRMKRLAKRLAIAGMVLAAIALVFVVMRPSPIEADVRHVARGPMRVTIDEEGETRARDPYTIAAPVAGRLERIEFEVGDEVRRGQTVARILPAPLDVESRLVAEARVERAEAAVREARAEAENAEARYEQARRSRGRLERLFDDGIVAREQYELARTAEESALYDLEAARNRVEAARSDLEAARAALVSVQSAEGGAARAIEVRSPIEGTVLRVLERSERVVGAGTPLVELGDPERIEIVVDVLSADAVRIAAGDEMLLEAWGGGEPLRARVRRVEPVAFTKVSALGVEEQRVNVIADFVERPRSMGVGYRVEARIVVWEGEEVLKAPTGALFRRGTSWSVFVVDGDRVRLREVEVGHRNQEEAEILGGLVEGDVVVLHPTEEMEEGDQVATGG